MSLIPAKISYASLLDVFWQAHDPTTLNRQGADVGTSYRSIILYRSEEQKLIAEKSRAAAQKNFKNPIVTEIVPLTKFYQAEDYHQEYYDNNSGAPYCQIVIAPKLQQAGEGKSDSRPRRRPENNINRGFRGFHGYYFISRHLWSSFFFRSPHASIPVWHS